MKEKQLLLSVLFFLVSATAEAQLDMVVNALAHANGVAMSNPPMPSIYGKKGQYKLGLQMGLLDGVKPASGDIKTLDYSGYNLAALYNKMLGNFWGLYLLTSISQVDGEITAPGANNSGVVDSTNLNSQLYMIGAGLTYTAMRNSWVTLPIMLGPAYLGGKFSGSFLHTNSGGTVLDDFDAQASPSYVGWMAGVQAAFHVNEHLAIIPYFLTLQPLTEKDKCQDFSTKNIRTSGNLFDQSSPGCNGNSGSNKSQLEFDVFVQTLGLNISIPTIGLTFNLYTETGDVPLFEGASVDFYSVSFSFGVP